MRSKAIKIIMGPAFCLLLISLISCDMFRKDEGIEFDYGEFNRQREAWESGGIESYSYEYYSSGFSFEHVRVQVSNGIYTSSEPLPDSMLEEYPYTMDDIFQQVEEYYLDGKNQDNSGESFYLTGIDVQYNSEFHFIEDVMYRYYKAPGLEVDGNFGFSIWNFAQ